MNYTNFRYLIFRNGILTVIMIVISMGTCLGQSSEEEPFKSYDAFCELFESSYASFEEKEVDWKAMCDEYRKKISSKTTDAQLFDIMSEMLKPLHDGHVTLRATNIDKAMSASRPSDIMKKIESIPRKERRPRFRKMTEITLVKNGFSPIKELGPKFRDEQLFSYTKNKNIGYLRFTRSFSKPSLMVGPSLNKQLDKIFGEFEGLDAIILDIRFNIGGDDKFSQNIAGRFTEKERIGFYKQTRKDGNFGELVPKTIRPKGKTPFLKKVILLTNDRSVSAADVLAMMMEQLPNATIIGERSNGSYSDLMNAKLPNGWKVTLSNQRYLTVDKKNYEGLGTPVDIESKNTLSDLENNEDSVLLKTLEFINEN